MPTPTPLTSRELSARVDAAIVVAVLLAVAAMLVSRAEPVWLVGQGAAFSVVTFVALAPAFGRVPVPDGPAITRRHVRLLVVAGVGLLGLACALAPTDLRGWDAWYVWLLLQAFAVPTGVLLGVVGGLVVLAMVVLPIRVVADHLGRGGRDLGLVAGLTGFGLLLPLIVLAGLAIGFPQGMYGGPAGVLAIWIPGVPTDHPALLYAARAVFVAILGCVVLARVLRVRPATGGAAPEGSADGA